MKIVEFLTGVIRAVKVLSALIIALTGLVLAWEGLWHLLVGA